MTHNDILNSYFEWLCRIVCTDRFPRSISYSELLMYLHSTQFRYSIQLDADRAGEGVYLRWRFVCENDFGYNQDAVLAELEGPCSVLEMMIAAAIHCEEHIMDDSEIGDRTGQWFWSMIANLGLNGMSNAHFDVQVVEDSVTRFLDRQYEPNGKGGLFTIKNCEHDLRKVPIFHQLCWYLNNIG